MPKWKSFYLPLFCLNMLPMSATKIDEINQNVYLNPNKNHWPNLFTINDQSINSSLASFFYIAPFLFALNSTLEKSSVHFWCRTGRHAPTPPPAQARLRWVCGRATHGLTPSVPLEGLGKHCSQQCNSCRRPASFFPSKASRGLSLTNCTGHLLFFSLKEKVALM